MYMYILNPYWRLSYFTVLVYAIVIMHLLLHMYACMYSSTDAVFTYLCSQHIWDKLPCVLITGCGYPPLSVRALVKTLSDQFEIPVLGLFDYNVSTSLKTSHCIDFFLLILYSLTELEYYLHINLDQLEWALNLMLTVYEQAHVLYTLLLNNTCSWLTVIYCVHVYVALYSTTAAYRFIAHTIYVVSAVDIKWLGIHHGDLFNDINEPKVPQSSLQDWTSADQQICIGLMPTVKKYIVSHQTVYMHTLHVHV